MLAFIVYLKCKGPCSAIQYEFIVDNSTGNFSLWLRTCWEIFYTKIKSIFAKEASMAAIKMRPNLGLHTHMLWLYSQIIK
jgi:hypothetical protein